MAEGEIKYGRDAQLEDEANRILQKSVRVNDRGIARDVEKMSYESGRISAEGLRHYDPDNDWDTHDSVFSIAIGDIESIAFADADGENVKVSNPKALERQALTRHVEDFDHWGSTGESIPLLGVNEGERKECTRCQKSKGLQFFSPDARNRDGLHSWCKPCRKEFTSQRRKNAT